MAGACSQLPGGRNVIDILGPVTAAAHGGCIECDPNDDRGDDLYVFALGGCTIRLCRHHLEMLQASIARCAERPSSPQSFIRPVVR